MYCFCFFFFFSSRRRHTRLQGDWSSDVCSSDLHFGVRNDLPENFEAMCRRSIEHFLEKVDNDYQRVFQESKVFHMRTEGVGKISAAEAINWGVTGPNLRACGVNVDLRRLDPYEVYEEIDFEPQVWHDGGAGDSY